MRVVSVQSWVSYGYVGHAAATFALQRLGHEVWPVPTVLFSNHTGYPTVHGRRVSAAEMADLVDGLDEREALATADAVLSGYLGDVEQVGVLADTVRRVRAAAPAASYTCDPVLGDTEQGYFVPAELTGAVRRDLVPLADLVTPNTFELSALTDLPVDDVTSALRAARELLALGPDLALVTSVPMGDDTIGMVAVTADEAWTAATPLLPLTPAGTGDLTAALATAHLHTTGSPRLTLERTLTSVYAVLEATVAARGSELALVAAQDDWATRAPRFPAERLD